MFSIADTAEFASDAEAEAVTLADVLARLGNVPAERVILPRHGGPATEADVLALEAAPRKRLCELVDGMLVEKALGYLQAILAAYLAHRLNEHVLARNSGLVSGPDGMVQLFAGRVRIPDVAFVSWTRIPGGTVPTDPIPGLVPDLAIEVLSPGNTAHEMELKRADYYASGVRQVWVVNSTARTVAVYTPSGSRFLSVADWLDGDDILPGFRLAVAELFGQLDRRPS